MKLDSVFALAAPALDKLGRIAKALTYDQLPVEKRVEKALDLTAQMIPGANLYRLGMKLLAHSKGSKSRASKP